MDVIALARGFCLYGVIISSCVTEPVARGADYFIRSSENALEFNRTFFLSALPFGMHWKEVAAKALQ